MYRDWSRRKWLTVAGGVAGLAACGGPETTEKQPAAKEGPLIESHLHLFDPQQFPYHSNATYQPEPYTLPEYTAFVKEAGIDGAVIVHPEPYQDDHAYLEHCFANEPSPGFFKGTCLLDPIDTKTPARMRELVEGNPNRIVALRIHEMHPPGTAFAISGAIKNRHLKDPRMKASWEAARDLGLAVQMHFLPYYAPMIGDLIAQVSGVTVILDHLSRAGMGTPEQYQGVLALAKHPKVYMKYSGVGYSSKQQPPYDDARPIVKQAWDAFGPDRIIWGGLGHNMEEFRQALATLDHQFPMATEEQKAKIKGGNSVKLYGFSPS